MSEDNFRSIANEKGVNPSELRKIEEYSEGDSKVREKTNPSRLGVTSDGLGGARSEG